MRPEGRHVKQEARLQQKRDNSVVRCLDWLDLATRLGKPDSREIPGRLRECPRFCFLLKRTIFHDAHYGQGCIVPSAMEIRRLEPDD